MACFCSGTGPFISISDDSAVVMISNVCFMERLSLILRDCGRSDVEDLKQFVTAQALVCELSTTCLNTSMQSSFTVDLALVWSNIWWCFIPGLVQYCMMFSPGFIHIYWCCSFGCTDPTFSLLILFAQLTLHLHYIIYKCRVLNPN